MKVVRFSLRQVGEDTTPVSHHCVSAVPFVIDDDEFAATPGLVDPPGGVEGTAQVETSVDEPSRDAGQSTGVSDDFAWGEP